MTKDTLEISVDGKNVNVIEATYYSSVLDFADELIFTFEPLQYFVGNTYNGTTKAQATVKVKINGELYFTGYIAIIDIQATPESVFYTAIARSKLCDLIDCNAVEKVYTQTDFLELTKAILKDNGYAGIVKVGTDLTLKSLQPPQEKSQGGLSFLPITDGTVNAKTPIARVDSQDFIYQALNKYAKKIGAVITSDQNGDLWVTQESDKKLDGSLILKLKNDNSSKQNNIISSNSNLRADNRFGRYVVFARPSIDILGNNTENLVYTSTDKQIFNRRVKHIVLDQQATKEEVINQAHWQENRARVDSNQYTCKVAGFTTNMGDVFKKNKLIDIDDAPSQQVGTKFIQSLKFTYSENGLFTDLTLTNKGALTLDTDLSNGMIPTRGFPYNLLKNGN